MTIEPTEILRPLYDITTKNGFCEWVEVANARDECLRRLRASELIVKAHAESDKRIIKAFVDQTYNEVVHRSNLEACLADCQVMLGRLKRECQISDNIGTEPDGRVVALSKIEKTLAVLLAKKGIGND